MKTNNLVVRIPEPCHEDWNSMTPDHTGKFCGSCSKSVIDFSNKTDAEIHLILMEKRNEKVCGHFRKSQVDRPLKFTVNFSDLPKNISTTRSFAIALFLVFGTLLFSCTDHQDKAINEIEVNKNELNKNEVENFYHSMGMVISPMIIEEVAPVIECTPEISEESEWTVDGAVAFGWVVDRTDTAMNSLEQKEEMLKGDTVVMNEQDFIPDTTFTPPVDSVFREEFTERMYLGGLSVFETEEEETAEINESLQNEEEVSVLEETLLNIYPNPASGEFNVQYNVLKRADVTLDIYDERGILVKSVVDVKAQYEGNYQIPVELKEVPNGLYIVRLCNNGKLSSKKIMIER